MDPDPTPDPTPFLSDFKDAKKMYFFLINYLQAPYLQPLKPNADSKRLTKKARHVYYKCFFEFNLATIRGLGGSILSKKNQNRFTLLNTFMR
jgi:hypothetical protein